MDGIGGRVRASAILSRQISLAGSYARSGDEPGRAMHVSGAIRRGCDLNQRQLVRSACVALAVSALAACSSGRTLSVPASPTATGRTQQSSSDSAKFTAETTRQKANLSDAELDAYIDTPLSPADRKLAHHFMRLMPANKRGDFVYVDTPAHIISNSAAVLRGVVLTHDPLASKATAPPAAVAAAAVRHTRDFQSSCSPPQPYRGSGPYLRAVGNCGFTGAIGYVEFGCNGYFFNEGESGTAYFELRGHTGTLTEGGLQFNNDNSIQPYHRSPSGYDNGLFYNSNQHYTCFDRAIGIMQGITPDSAYSFTGVGLPTSQPSGTYLSPNATWNHAAWHYFNRENDMFQPGNDAEGNSTPCMGCSISRVTSEAQNGGDRFPDNSYFGILNLPTSRSLLIHWHQVTMGQIVQPCDEHQSGSTTCSLRFNTDYRSWFGGYQYYPDPIVSITRDRNGTDQDPYETYEGIDPRQAGQQVASISRSSYTDPYPPSATTTVIVCTMDSSVYFGYQYFYPGDTDPEGTVIPPGTMEKFRYRFPRDPSLGC